MDSDGRDETDTPSVATATGAGPPERTGVPEEPGERVAEKGGIPEALEEESCSDIAWHSNGYPHGEQEYESGRVPFAVQVRDDVVPYRLMSLFVMPGERLPVEAVQSGNDSRFTAEADAGDLVRVGPDAWEWTAPGKPGIALLEVCDVTYRETVHLKIFVLRPYGGENRVNGYRIGSYEGLPLRGDPAYERVDGFVEVHPETEDEWLSPHFQLRQFVCKQDAGYPRYLILRTRLLMKLEMLLERVNDRGISAGTLFVMSGFRTPYYNAAIGNKSRYSRHAYGDAADIFVDEDRDGVIDDLNRDGRSNEADAAVLFDLIESLYGEAWYMPFTGGLSVYGASSVRTAFVHTDTRGTRARW